MNQPYRDLSATTRPVTGADLLARRLAAAGIRTAFGIPGGEVLALVEHDLVPDLAVVSIAPMVWEWYRRRKAAGSATDTTGPVSEP